MPVQPIASPRRAQARANFTAASAAFATLSSSEQTAWTSYANSHPRTDSLGQAIILTGHAMFVAISSALLNLGLTINNIPPASDAIPPIANLLFVAYNSDGIVLRVDPPGTGMNFLVAASRAVSGGVTFMSTYRQFGIIGATESSFDLTTQFIAQFGVPPIGSRIFLRLTPVSDEGVTGTPAKVIAEVGTSSALAIPTGVADPVGNILVSWASGPTNQDVYGYYNDGTTPGDEAAENLGAATGQDLGPMTVGREVYFRTFDGTTFSSRGGPMTVT